ncbi:MAG TPA: nucleotidyltransferase family protein [Negativicutes bacterium]|nr:nucleotidyltransferase family protein [Negativicutes bacterium]
MEITAIKKKLRNSESVLKERFLVKKIGIFGSYVQGEQHKKSDLDILVEFIEDPSFFKFLDLENYLSDTFGINVDLVMKNALKPAIGKKILSEVVYP